MVWKAKFTRPVYADKTIRVKRVFAWMPTYIDGSFIWLGTYEVLQIFTIKAYAITEKEAVQVSEWINVSKRLIK